VGEAAGRLVAKRGHTKLATMAFNNPSGREITGGAKARVGKNGTATGRQK
jgi:hypothetical protein